LSGFGWSDDDTRGRTEPETVDVWADQAPTTRWSSEAISDAMLDDVVREMLDADFGGRLGQWPE
jgi:hypothetical protein